MYSILSDDYIIIINVCFPILQVIFWSKVKIHDTAVAVIDFYCPVSGVSLRARHWAMPVREHDFA